MGAAEEQRRIAEVAADAFYRHGVTASGVDALSAAAGISKKTLYQRFGSKQALIAAALTVRDDDAYGMFTDAAESVGDDPVDQLLGLFDALPRLSREHLGCPFLRAAGELPDPSHPARSVVRGHKERLRRWVEDRLRAADVPDAPLVSRQLMLLFDGALSGSYVYRDDEPFSAARAAAQLLITAAR
jgi:AcrR family transcriptional regulator